MLVLDENSWRIDELWDELARFWEIFIAWCPTTQCKMAQSNDPKICEEW